MKIMIKKLFYYLLQIKALLIFGKRVYAHGNFKVGNRKNVSIGNMCSINTGVYILAHCKISIGNRVTLSARAMLIDSGLDKNSSDRSHIDSYIIINDGVWVGAGAIILPGVVIGSGSIVGAGSVVTKSVPSMCVVAGNPARIIRRLDDAYAETKGSAGK